MKNLRGTFLDLYKKNLIKACVFLQKGKPFFNIAKTPEEKMKIFKFRYNVYYEQLGRHVPGLDHRQKIIMDEIDMRDSTLHLFQNDINNPSLVMRCVVWEKDTMIPAIKHDFDLHHHDWINRLITVELGRLMSNPMLKSRVNTLRFIISALKFLETEKKANLIIASCKPGLVSNYMNIGLRPYTKKHIDYPDGLEVPLAGFLDKTYTTLIDSPLKTVINDHAEIKKEYYSSFFSDDALVVYDTEKVISLLRNETCLNKSLHSSMNDFETCAYYGAFILNVSNETKVCHANMKENDEYFLLNGKAYIFQENGKKNFFSPGTFITDFTDVRERDVYCRNCSLLVLKKSILEKIKLHNKTLYERLVSFRAKQTVPLWY